MDNRFSDATRAVLRQAEKEARRLGSPLVGTEHLLLGLLGAGQNRAADSLLGAGATLDGCRSKVVELADPAETGPTDSDPGLSARARRTLERADRLSLRLRASHVEPEHVLESLLGVEGRAGQVLRGLGVDLSLLRDSAGGESVEASHPTSPEAGVTTAVPRCPGCGADVSGGGLSHAPVPSRSAEGRSRVFEIVYCSTCGTSLGVL